LHTIASFKGRVAPKFWHLKAAQFSMAFECVDLKAYKTNGFDTGPFGGDSRILPAGEDAHTLQIQVVKQLECDFRAFCAAEAVPLHGCTASGPENP
jgi:hypothetical protein